MIDKKNYLKFYLKEFYIDKINPFIWKSMKGFSILDNLIIKIPNDTIKVKYIISSLILNHRERLNFFSVRLFDLLDLQFKDEEKDKRIQFSSLIYPEVLIIKEFNDPNNKLYFDILNNIVTTRILENKNTILLLMTKSHDDLLNEEILRSFKIISLKNNIVKNKNKSNTKGDIIY